MALKSLVALIMCAFMGLVSVSAKEFHLKNDSHIGFRIKKMGFMNVKGHFKQFSGTLNLESPHNIKSLQGEIVIDSVFSDSKKRDKHLLEADYFNASVNPKGIFVMTSYEINSTEERLYRGTMRANLTLNGVEKNIAFDYSLDISDATMPKLTLESKLNIKDFGMKGSGMHSDEAMIEIETLWEE
ncbi:hypothetical protein CQA53_09620 [Helicobacter didelphidarum]|uniref:Lipid/polyisoprenoid-binding YceI-like domain-containing protein n=1 Tax=Helicobacter didelphidarum TaxID=2040648 RepID=A0A3D8IAU2_9HELI|nr:YceI family protein [Helicobacter didelphidarum]RDU62066.1 hypothetical protein CQA53_09620 [Helicobacter didelphidarum]